MKRCIFVLAALALGVGVGCSSDDSEPEAPATESTVTSATTATTTAAFDPQAYCVEKLGPLKAKYPKSLGGADLAAECQKMIRETDATSAKTIDALLETAESYYKVAG